MDISDRAVALLLALIDAGGAPLSKEQLAQQVSPDADVDDESLQALMLALHRVLDTGGDELIKTVQHRGYRFTGGSDVAPAMIEADSVWSQARAGMLPAPVAELIGREPDLLRLTELHAGNRLLTLCGPGGIGKTSLALAIGHRVANDYPDGVLLVDLASLADADLVLPTIAGMLGLRWLPLPLAAQTVAAALASQRLLLLLDNCEHVINTVASIVDALLHGAPNVHILATSREPLRADGECVYRVAPLPVPDNALEDAASQVRYPAVQLFLARARAADATTAVGDDLIGVISGICRRLDGIPLAIELAAARAAVLGVEAVAAGLDDRFRLLTGGRRTAMPRHQTLRSALDWSFDLLDPFQRKVLCRLGVFVGTFTLEAAQAVALHADDPPDIEAAVGDLVARSLISAEGNGGSMRYRLLETTRLYVLQLLSPPDFLEARRRHLRFYTARMQFGFDEWPSMQTNPWVAKYAGDIENIRAALRWSLALGGIASDDAALGATLAATSMPLWLESSLHTECRQWAEAALAIGGTRGTRREVVLQLALGTVLLNAGGSAEQVEAALQRSLTLAEAIDDREYVLRAVYGLWVHRLHEGSYETALEYAEKFRATAELTGDMVDIRTGERLIGTSEHYLGRQGSARVRLERTADSRADPSLRSRESRFGTDQRVARMASLARVLALQGALDQALATAWRAVEAAGKLDRVASLCGALAELCVVSIWIGNLDVLAEAIRRLGDVTRRYGLQFWQTHALAGQGVLAVSHQDNENAAALFDAVLDEPRFDLTYPSLTGALAEGLAAIGRSEQARSLVDRSLQRPGALQRWSAPHLLVIRGNLRLEEPSTSANFTQALQLAREQEALLLELRAADGLARLEARSGGAAEARATLEGVYVRFTEGLDTPHLRAARATLAQLC